MWPGDRRCRAPRGGSAGGSPGLNGGSWDWWGLPHHLHVPEGLSGPDNANTASGNTRVIFLRRICTTLWMGVGRRWRRRESCALLLAGSLLSGLVPA